MFLEQIEVGKNYYYIGIGYKNLLNKIVSVVSEEVELFNGYKVFLVEDEQLNKLKVLEFNLSKNLRVGQIRTSLEKQLIPDAIPTFCSFKDEKYVGDYQ